MVRHSSLPFAENIATFVWDGLFRCFARLPRYPLLFWVALVGSFVYFVVLFLPASTLLGRIAGVVQLLCLSYYLWFL